ncbi:MAG: alpha/beta fold hydrolase [Archaeoglobaceae archaeon]|nr:alpha/beta fold hydrolase [Archaeoglobaceae archaeon]MDW7989665.1 alpha/beta fold hydrolase [Archaeoglobaceae archaeon]
MQVLKRIFSSMDGKEVPAYIFSPEERDKVLLIHGYSSSKDEMLGLAFRVAEKGYSAIAIDLRGHGENENEFDENVLNDVEGVLREVKMKGEKIITFGHSLGGLLSLSSSSDFAIAVSPPLMSTVTLEVEFMLRINSCKVLEKNGAIFRILKNLNPPERRRNATIFFGKGESEGIKMAIRKWAEGREVNLIEIEEKQAKLPDLDVDGEKLKVYIPKFVSHQATIHARRILEFFE